MPRKATGSTTRSKKTSASPEPTPVQAMPEVQAAMQTEVQAEVKKDSGKNGKPAIVAPSRTVASTKTLVSFNLEEEIRRRAYELYLQRKAATGAENGNPNQDWLIAEHEVRARYNQLARHTTA